MLLCQHSVFMMAADVTLCEENIKQISNVSISIDFNYIPLSRAKGSTCVSMVKLFHSFGLNHAPLFAWVLSYCGRPTSA